MDECRSCDCEPALLAKPRRSTSARILLIAVLAGVATRCLAFVLNLEIYFDAAYCVNSILVRDYQELLGPLDNFQIAPPLFSWIVKACIGLGTSDRLLRLLPLGAGLLSLLLFAVLCRQVLRGSAAWFALAILSTSHVAILASMRAKPYSTDLLVGVTFTLLAVRWLARPQRAWPVIAMAILAPIVVWLSYTSVFVIGGIGLVLAAWAVVHRRQICIRTGAAIAAIGVLALASFGALHVVNLRDAMSNAGTSGAMYDAWSAAFPPLESLPRTLWWLVKMHTGRLYSYPFGENNFGSTLSFVCWCVGLVALYRRSRNAWLLAILLAPQALLLAAAFAGKYPYGGHARISLFLAPAMCLLIGAGIARLTGRLRYTGRRRCRTVLASLLVLSTIIGMVKVSLDALATYRGPSIRTFITTISEQTPDNAPVFCLNTQRLIAGGGPARQIFEYYMQRILGERIRWAWDGQWPTPADTSNLAKVTVIEFVSPGEPDPAAEATRQALQARYGEAFDPDHAQRCPILSRHPGEARFYELPVEAEAPQANNATP
ncbi:MAG: glycosyltransferase family 39 protein [Phycisphaerae bacterium]|nr:glycosyltransferase family 39 protein [Phycisphaerae bacterium]